MQPTTDTLTLHCPAKLNLTLAVGLPREDGMHPIASVMVAIDFGDTLELRRLEDGPSVFERRFADDAPKPQPIDWPIENDLAYRAHARMQEHVGRPLPVACTIGKRIPAGAGLGGGSSNAAAMLVGLNKLFNLSIHDKDMRSLAQQLGADVVFLLQAILGQPSALVSGIGEVIEPIGTLPAFHCVLVFPQGNCPTAAIYRTFDASPQATSSTSPDHFLQVWRSITALPPPHNDLTAAAMQVCPAIKPATEAMNRLGLTARVTGSGSTLFAIVESKEQSIAIANKLTQDDLPAIPARFSGLSHPV